jgi:hypothetical protein
MISKTITSLAAAVGAALVLASGVAVAESQYGYNSAGTGTVTAQASVKLSVTVPKLILLRVGSTNTTQDTLTWTGSASIPPAPTAPTNGVNTQVPWDGTVPTISAGTQPAAISVYAWTNATTGSINCTTPAWTPATGGPANADFSVTVTGTLPHPGANLGACASQTFASNTIVSGTWAYVLAGTPASWKAGSYTATVLYTATGI